MEKEFNVTGTCIPEMHYMVDTSDKLKEIIKLIEKAKYFIINRPRQYGKTTTLYMLERGFDKNNEYLTISISFEGVGDLIFEEEQRFTKAFLNLAERSLLLEHGELSELIEEQKLKVETMDDLSCMLRNKYLLRNSGKDKTFHSVILAGVHDVKSLKLKIRPDEEHKYNSPWNIASDFDVDMSFSKEEIGTMLDDYIKDKGVKLDKEYFSERLYFYTSGYPFLVSKLCKIIDEKIMDMKQLKWDKEYMDRAVKELLKNSNTNFDSLIKNLENNITLKELIKKITVDGSEITYNKDNPTINLGVIYGIFKDEHGKLKIHNRIYEQKIYDYMSSLIETSTSLSFYNERSEFIKRDGSLDIRKILIKFQDFMKHEYSEKREGFLEEDGRLLFLAFLSPIINGTGFAFKEVKGGEEKRFDIVITYNKKMYILELKIWRGDKYHEKGLIQLGEYLEQYGLDQGYLLIFDFRKVKGIAGKVEEVTAKINEKQKKIVEVYC
ncbi:AAA family ATPase [Clostridium sp.]|uniref:AAA family ATPase n=1 Tax=Clostridium sp. TaxID=1506 RepID=UPI00258800E6|nr:AAA family ATPase [Clostridium sp.]MDF2505983.1 hypothetical protein [Clostridium sp.]